MGTNDESIPCKICERDFADKTSLVEHLRIEHEILEIASYAASTMIQEEERDKVAREFHRQFEQIKRELAGR
jgi:tRNA U54 and U55 pseudouridine synthase Pus10